MKTMRVSEARDNLYKLIDEAAQTHKPILIAGKRGNAVLLGEDEWRAVEETLYLLSVPGMRESIIEGIKAPIGKCKKSIEW